MIFGDLPWPALTLDPPSPPISNRDLLIPPAPPEARLHSKAPLLHDKRPYIHPRVDCSNIIQHRACQGEVAGASIGAAMRGGEEGKRVCTLHMYISSLQLQEVTMRSSVASLLHYIVSFRGRTIERFTASEQRSEEEEEGEEEWMGWERKGREFISTQGNCWHSVCASAREISASSVRVRSLGILRPFLRFSSAPRKHIPHFPFLPSIHSRRPWPPHVSQSVFGREREREREREGSRYTILSPTLPSPLPHPASERRSALSNTMQHPPIHRCFSHPHIALLDQSTTSYPIKRSSLLSE